MQKGRGRVCMPFKLNNSEKSADLGPLCGCCPLATALWQAFWKENVIPPVYVSWLKVNPLPKNGPLTNANEAAHLEGLVCS